MKILTVQKASGSVSGTGPKAKLEFTKSLFEKEYAELHEGANQRGWSGGDLRFGRWRNGGGDLVYASAMEGRHTLGPSLLAPLLLRSSGNFHFPELANSSDFASEIFWSCPLADF